MTDVQLLIDGAAVVSEQGARVARDYNKELSLLLTAAYILLNLHIRWYAKRSQNEQTSLLKQLVRERNMVPIIWKGARYKTTGRSGKIPDLLIIHGMGGSISGTTSWFQNVFSFVSAHAGVGESEIHEYVSPSDTAWQAGKWDINLRSYGLEIQNQPLNEQILENAKTYLLEKIIPQVFADRRPDRSWIWPHSQVVATQCPKGIDVDAFVSDLQVRWDRNHQPAAEPVRIPVKMAAFATGPLRVRTAPRLNASVLRTMKAGDGFWYIGKEAGDSVSGNDQWFLLEDGHYAWTGAAKLNN